MTELNALCCGQPAGEHDDEVCRQKLAALRPTGFIDQAAELVKDRAAAYVVAPLPTPVPGYVTAEAIREAFREAELLHDTRRIEVYADALIERFGLVEGTRREWDRHTAMPSDVRMLIEDLGVIEGALRTPTAVVEVEEITSVMRRAVAVLKWLQALVGDPDAGGESWWGMSRAAVIDRAVSWMQARDEARLLARDAEADRDEVFRELEARRSAGPLRCVRCGDACTVDRMCWCCVHPGELPEGGK